MTFLELQTLLSELLNNTSTNRWSTTTRKRFLNMAYHDICSADVWPFLQKTDSSLVTVASTATVNWPSDFKQCVSVWITPRIPSNKLMAMTQKETEAVDYSQNGRPLRYIPFGTQLKLFPTPDAVYSLILEYQKKVTDMSADGDEPIFDSEFHHLIALKAAAYLKKTSGGTDVGEAGDLLQDVNVGINNMRARILPREIDRPKQVADVIDIQNYDNLYNTYY